MIQEQITSDYRNARIDTWVRHRWPHIPHGSIQKAIRRGLIRVDGKKVQPSARLDQSSFVFFKKHWPSLFAPPQESPPISSRWKERIEKWILYEDDAVVVLNKPRGIACQGGSSQALHVDGLMQSWRKGQKIRLVHRLDVQTSGVLVMAKTLSCARDLSLAFREHLVKKVYWALVEGNLPTRGKVRAPLERRGRLMISSSALGAQHCLTRYVCRGTHSDVSWAEIYPCTGRMHQIRAHMALIGHPIQGDDLYGSGNGKTPLSLHCREISWNFGNKKYSFVAPCPKDFQKNGEDFSFI